MNPQTPMTLVVPHEPEKSYFYLKLSDAFLDAGGSGAKMPIQSDPLSAEQLGTIRAWIEEGAPDN